LQGKVFPIPTAMDDEHRVYLSVGHQQMMTDAMKPLGLSFWQMTTPRPMAEAGSRLFVDVTQALASPAGRAGLINMAGRSDPLIADALQTIVDRGFIPTVPDATRSVTPQPPAQPEPIDTDPAVVAELIAANEASVAALRREIATRSGTDLIDFIEADVQELRRLLFDPRSHQVFMSAMEATWWLNDHLLEWLGEKNAADTLSQSVPDNVTSEMGPALTAVADVVRSHPAVVAFLEHAGDGFLEALPAIAGGPEATAAIEGFLARYGMRCAGEIDITRPRWSERPATLVPQILANVRTFEAGEGERRFEQGRREALAKERDVLARVRALPDGDAKAREVKARIDRVRTFIGYREYPKYGMVSRSFVYKQAILGEADRLVTEGVLDDQEDVFYLRFEELRAVVATRHVDAERIRARREAFLADSTLTAPRLLTSDGEGLNGSYRRDDVPPGALVGLPVSAGIVEGRARVILDMAASDLDAGDILVTAFTDPSWTPLFVSIRGLVTEVGGLMTHGAVIAREYGLPAVVGVDRATRRIRDGQRIRLDGTSGLVEILD
jgi:rifampicin phosphotransferase